MPMRPSVRDAEAKARKMRRLGYPEAIAAPEYCTDGDEVGPDGFCTYAVAVYAGRKAEPATRLPKP